ncbi:MAG: cobyrinate a,c-diamide synthase [Nitrospinota bacterium]
MKATCPTIVVASTSSGAGKTSVSLALTGALKRRGLKVQTFKVGPDFLDPTYLAAATGRDCFNLDGWMAGKEYVLNLFANETANADIAVIEGVMGLFDGADSATSEGSTAEIASWLNAPVLLTVNARGMARSIAAMVKGFCTFEEGVNVAGVIANHAGSERHRQWLSDSLLSSSLPPLLGAIPKNAFPELKSRHLGLMTADISAGRKNFNSEILERFADVFEENVSVDEIIKLAKSAPAIDIKNVSTSSAQISSAQKDKKIRLGLAFDGAFHFYYPDNLKALERLGCEIVNFSPVSDKKLPDDLNGVYFGGGYPEEFAAQLSANESMMEDIRKFAESGRPVYAECGGLVYLSEGLETLDGTNYKMAGVLPSGVKMRKNFKNLGYVEATITGDTILGRRGEKLRGHRFHYSELTRDPSKSSGWNTVYSLSRRRSKELISEGYQRKGVLASYVHTHIASRPQALKSFVESCAGK